MTASKRSRRRQGRTDRQAEALREQREVYGTKMGRSFVHTMCRWYPDTAAQMNPVWLVDEINRLVSERDTARP